MQVKMYVISVAKTVHVHVLVFKAILSQSMCRLLTKNATEFLHWCMMARNAVFYSKRGETEW